MCRLEWHSHCQIQTGRPSALEPPAGGPLLSSFSVFMSHLQKRIVSQCRLLKPTEYLLNVGHQVVWDSHWVLANFACKDIRSAQLPHVTLIYGLTRAC